MFVLPNWGTACAAMWCLVPLCDMLHVSMHAAVVSCGRCCRMMSTRMRLSCPRSWRASTCGSAVWSTTPSSGEYTTSSRSITEVLSKENSIFYQLPGILENKCQKSKTHYVNWREMFLVHLSTKCSWWAIVTGLCPSSVVVRRSSCVNFFT